MCGILFTIGNDDITADHPALNIISHRGPDAFGAEKFELPGFKVCLGHRRLSIIDLSDKGRQPMSLDNGRYWVTYNGEIYNYIEIREQLRADGFEFHSGSDTEVLLVAYKKWGRACLDKFNGMFAFCLFDTVARKVFIARDRFGVKPLNYTNTPGAFRVASEIKQFTAFDDFTPECHREMLWHFLATGDFDFDSQTMWKGVRELDPGHLIELDLDKWRPGDDLRPERWYSPPFFDERLDITYDEAVAEFRRLLESSMKLRMRADVPVGFLLSGGLDSSTLIGLAHGTPREEGAHLKTYSSCYDDKLIDEREYIKAVLEFTGADSCLHFPKPEDVAGSVDSVIWHNDLPVLQGSPVPHYLLYKRIREENDSRKVIVEGQGGDEILCGYGDFYWAFLNELLRGGKIASFGGEFVRFMRLHKEPLKIVARKFYRMNFGTVKRPSIPFLNPQYFDVESFAHPSPAISREEPNVAKLHEDRFKILRYILHNVDRNSMSQSRETRVPFLDYRLVEFCLRLPSAFKMSGELSKKILRDAARDVLPEKVRLRSDKQGYSSPVPRWAKKYLRSFLNENLTDLCGTPIVNGKSLSAAFDKFVNGDAPFDPLYWRLASANQWIKLFKIRF